MPSDRTVSRILAVVVVLACLVVWCVCTMGVLHSKCERIRTLEKRILVLEDRNAE